MSLGTTNEMETDVLSCYLSTRAARVGKLEVGLHVGGAAHGSSHDSHFHTCYGRCHNLVCLCMGGAKKAKSCLSIRSFE